MKGTYWSPEPEVWSAEKCTKIAKARATDGYGSRHPYAGLVQASSATYGYGRRRFNGGVVKDGEWYEGTNIPYPIIPDEYELINRPTWGTYLVLK